MIKRIELIQFQDYLLIGVGVRLNSTYYLHDIVDHTFYEMIENEDGDEVEDEVVRECYMISKDGDDMIYVPTEESKTTIQSFDLTIN